MKKKVLITAVITVITMISSTFSVSAAEEDYITFRGEAEQFVTSISGSAQQGFTNMEPGETRTLELTLKNDSSDEMKFFMSADLLKDIAEEGNKQAVYDFTIQKNNEPQPFFSAMIGGNEENISVGKEYLTNDNSILLDTLKRGETGEVSVSLAFDGDSMGNEYQNTTGSLEFVFYAQTPEKAPTVVNKVINYVKGETVHVIKNVQTGDAITLGVVGIIMISLIGLVVVLLIKKKKNNLEEK